MKSFSVNSLDQLRRFAQRLDQEPVCFAKAAAESGLNAGAHEATMDQVWLDPVGRHNLVRISGTPMLCNRELNDLAHQHHCARVRLAFVLWVQHDANPAINMQPELDRALLEHGRHLDLQDIVKPTHDRPCDFCSDLLLRWQAPDEMPRQNLRRGDQ